MSILDIDQVVFEDAELTRDHFLGGQLQILQPRTGYRAGVDPVFLAAAIDAVADQRVLDLGCGAGVAALCLARRVPGVGITGVEVQADYADLAHRNAAGNEINFEIIVADVAHLPTALRARAFDHVICNPPYFRANRRTAAADQGRDTALAGETPLPVWADTAIRRLKPGGHLTMILHAQQLGDILASFDSRVGSIRVKPLAPREGRAAELIIVQARKGGRGELQVLAPLILHQGSRHERDGDSYTETVSAILRHAAPLEMC